MGRIQRLLPAANVQRARLGAVVFAVISVLPLISQIDPAISPLRRVAAVVSILLLVTIYLVTYLRSQVPPLDWLVIPVATVIAGTALLDPVATTALCVSSLAALSQFGSDRVTYLRLIGLIIAFPATIAIQPVSLGRLMSWNSGPVLSLIPHLFMITVMVRVLHSSLARQQLIAAREGLLAQTGRQLIHQTELSQVRAIAAQTAEALCAQVPGTAMMVVRRDGQQASVESVAGLPDLAAGTTLDAAIIESVDAADGQIRSLDGPVAAALQDVVQTPLRWRAAVVTDVRHDMLLLVGGLRAVTDLEVEAFRTLITQRSLAEANCGAHAELSYRAHTDQLTDLPNRAMFFARLAATVDGAVGAEGRVALLMIDLDDFKQVNDVYGHAAGDQVLIEVGSRLAEIGGTTGISARFGGDEFALLLPGLDDPSAADAIAAQLSARLGEPVRLTQATVRVGASIGIASGTPNLTAADLMRCADIAMYMAKAQGKNRVQRFSRSDYGDLAHVRQLEDHLGYAVARGEMTVCHEPLIALDTGRCIGTTASLHWEHPLLGILPAEEFIPIAERTGAIAELGAFLLRTACADVAAWPSDGATADLRLTVDASPFQIREPGYVDLVLQALADAGLAADRLTLGLTDSECLSSDNSAAAIRALAEHGVRIAINDFGVRSVSLASLRSHPIGQIKVSGAHALNQDSSSIFEMALSIAGILGVETVANEVETQAQATAVQTAHVTMARGPFYGEPMPADAFLGWTRTGWSKTVSALAI